MSNLPKFYKPENLGEFVIIEKKLKQKRDKSSFYLLLIVKNEFTTYRVYCFENAKYYNESINLKDRVNIRGYYTFFNGYENIKAVKITKELSIDSYFEKLNDLIDYIWDEECQILIKLFLEDKEFSEKFTTSPASLNSHHAYKGGLLVHTVTAMELGLKFSELKLYQNKIDLDILLTGLFFHDIGKIYSYSESRLTKYEKLLGHIAIGEKILDKLIKEREVQIKKETYLHLNHIILTHHSQTNANNYGLKPMTNEAKLVNKIESLDAEIDEFNLKVI